MKNTEGDNIVRNSYILMMGYFLSSIISTIGTILMIRLISVEEYSLINIAFILPGILVTFGELGLNYASTHFIAKNLKNNDIIAVRNVIRINIIIKIIIGTVLTVLIIIFSEYISKEIYKVNDVRMIFLVQLSSIGVIFGILLEALNSFFLGAENMKMVRVGTILRTSLRSGLSIILILFGLTLIGPLIGFVLSTLIVAIFFSFFVGKIAHIDKNHKTPIKWNDLLKMLKYGYPLLILSFVIGASDQLFSLILVNFGYIIEVGYFNVALTSAVLIGILTKSIRMTLFPIFSKKDWENGEKDREKLIKHFQFSIKFATLLIIPITFLVIIFSESIFPLIFGEEYRKADLFIKFYFMHYTLVAFGSLSIPSFLNGQKRTINVLYMESINLITAIIVGLFLVSIVGPIGIIYGIIIGTIISTIYGNIVIRIYYGKILFLNRKKIIAILSIAIISGIITYFVFSIIKSMISFEGFLIDIIILLISFAIYSGIFLVLIGFLSLITVEEVDFFVNSFDIFPVVNKMIRFLAKVEKKIINFK